MSNRRNRATSRDVAALARVSQSSVSRAFTQGGSLSLEKRQRILDAAAALNYVPNAMARSLITRRSGVIAIILGNIGNPFYIHVLGAFIARLQERGFQTLTFTIEPGATSDEAILQVLRHQVDGIVLTAAQLSTRSTALCRDRGIPLVLFNRYIPGSDTSVVRCDNVGGGRVMARAMLDAGARTFAVIRGDPMGTTSQDRAQGFLEALWDGGVARSAVREIEGGSAYDGAFEAIRTAFADAPPTLPEAIFAVNDIMAMGVIDALRGVLGKRVPEDVMVAGFDDIVEAGRWPYSLTTMRQPIAAMVDQTLALLLPDEEDGPADSVDRQVESVLVVRKTLRPPAIDSSTD